MALVQLESLEKVYAQGQIEVPALRGINLQVEEGEFTTIFGPSGSGKTTLLNMIGCLDRPTAGRVFFDGRDITGLSKRELAMIRRHHVGFIFQSYNLIPVLTAYENVEFALRIIDDKSAGEIRRAVLDMLEAVGLAGLEDRKPGELSGGQKQRVAIARALVKRPRLVLADEPTANLDSQTSTDVLEVMLQMNKQMNTTFIFSTHDPRVMEYARRMVEIRDGQVARDERRGAEGVSVETGLEESNPA